MSWRNTVEKWLAVRNPTSCEMRAMDGSRAASRVAACSIRARTTKRWGGRPVLCWKRRAKWKGLM